MGVSLFKIRRAIDGVCRHAFFPSTRLCRGQLLEALEPRQLFSVPCPDRDSVPLETPPSDTCPYPTPPGRGPSGGDSGAGGPPSQPNKPTAGGQLGGNPQPGATTKPVRALDGLPLISSTDLSSDGFGGTWGVTRSWAGINNAGALGNGWAVTNQPYLLIHSTDGGTVIGAVDSGSSVRLFDFPQGGDGDRMARYYGRDRLIYSEANERFELRDALGNVAFYNDLPRNQFGWLNTAVADANQGKYGKIQCFIDASGNTTKYEYDSSGLLLWTQRSNASGTSAERFEYQYATVANANASTSLLASTVTLTKGHINNTDSQYVMDKTVRSASYTYYTGATSSGADDPNGRLGDLKSVTIRDFQRNSAGDVVGNKYYRYYKFTGYAVFESSGPTNNQDTTGGPDALSPRSGDNTVFSGLKTVVEGSSASRLSANVSNYHNASDAIIEPYVDHFFKYERWADDYWDSDWEGAYHMYTRYRAIEEIAAGEGCSTCSGGQGTFKYEYVHNTNNNGSSYSNGSFDAGVWRMRTTEFLSDTDDTTWADNDREVFYLNEKGQTMLKVVVDVSDDQRAITGISYTSGTVTVTAANHGFTTGDFIAMAGMSDYAFNGVAVVTRINSNTFTYSLPSNLKVFNSTPTVGTNAAASKVLAQYRTYSQYDSAGRAVLTASPSAVTNHWEASDDLLNDPSSPGGDREGLANDSGLITTTVYTQENGGANTTATATVAGNAEGYVSAIYVQRGENDSSPDKQEQRKYFRRGDTYPIASVSTYENVDGSGELTTKYFYDEWHPNTHTAKRMRVEMPMVSSVRNGSGGTAGAIVSSVFDVFGRETWRKDAGEFIHYQTYDDATGALTRRIVDVDTDETGDFTGLPSGWSNANGLHLKSTMVVDGVGRVVAMTDPNGNVTHVVYKTGEDSGGNLSNEVRTYRGWHLVSNNGTPSDPSDDVYATTGPISVSRQDWSRKYNETFTMSVTPTAVNGVPSGNEAVNAIQSLTRHILNNVGQRLAINRYFSLSGTAYSVSSTALGSVSDDSASGNHHAVQQDYDGRGRLKRVETAAGSITRYVYDVRGLLVQRWVGTDDEPAASGVYWSPSYIGSDVNMRLVSTYTYDANGNRIAGVDDPNSSSSGDERVTKMYYDYRDRLTAVKAGDAGGLGESESVQRQVTYYTYDNLSRVTSTATYDGDTVVILDANADGVPDAPSTDRLRTKMTMEYDERNRQFRQSQQWVNPDTGTIDAGKSLITSTWFDDRNLVIKQSWPNAASTKTEYDGAGRPTVVYTTDATGDSGFTDATNVNGDTVLEQLEYVYDGNGNVIHTRTRQRFHDATATGKLGDPSSTSLAKARISYTGRWYDALNRLTASVNFGTNGGTLDGTGAGADLDADNNGTSDRPAAVPLRSDKVLVTGYGYDAAGRQSSTVNPRGFETRTEHDLMGRKTRTIEAYADGLPSNSDDRTTAYTYNGAGQVRTLKAVLPDGADADSDLDVQETRYVYGVTPTDGSTLFSNDLLREVRYPSKTTGLASTTEAENSAYNALGERISSTDRKGTTHQYGFDALGRLVLDHASTLGSSVDTAVNKIAYGFDSAGRRGTITSLNGSTVVNQVKYDYNGFGQTTSEYQAHGGAVAVSTPRVQYGYSDSIADNHSRLTSVTYPSGRVVIYDYLGANGIPDANISRLSRLREGVTPLEAYSYLGLGTHVVLDRGTASKLTYVGASNGEAGDSYVGLDRFGRVIDQRWTSSGGDLDQFKYTYDRNSNRTRRDVALSSAPTSGADQVDEYYAYDKLDRLIEQRRGTFTASNTMGSAALLAAWNLDALGNVTGYVTVTDPTAGDANLDGWVDFADLQLLSANYNGVGQGAWRQGDFDANGTTDFTDLLALSRAYDNNHQKPQGNVASTDERTYNAQNQLTGMGGSTLSYDANGNQEVDQGGYVFGYDAWNRPVSAYWTVAGEGEVGYSLVIYKYDGLGRLIFDGQNSQYFNNQWQVLEEHNAAGTAVRAQYTWSPVYVDALVVRSVDLDGDGLLTGSHERLFVQWDANFNVTSVSDAALGGVIERYRYAAYGNRTVLNADWSVDILAGSDVTTADDGSAGWNASDVGLRHGHQGGAADRAVAGKVHFRHRTLDVEQMRWVSTDPLIVKNSESLSYMMRLEIVRSVEMSNIYSYEISNPSTFLDPMGLATLAECSAKWLNAPTAAQMATAAATCAAGNKPGSPAYWECVSNQFSGIGKKVAGSFYCCLNSGLPLDVLDQPVGVVTTCQAKCDFNWCVREFTNSFDPYKRIGTKQSYELCNLRCTQDKTCDGKLPF